MRPVKRTLLYLDNIAIGVFVKDSVIIAIVNPIVSLVITSLVASGVTSLLENPVPPVVTTKSSFSSSVQFIRALFIISFSSLFGFYF